MRNGKTACTLIVLILLFSVLPAAVWSEPADAPRFTLQNAEGENISLEDFRGSWIHLDFSADWCHWCHFQAEYIDDVEKILDNLDIKFISVTILSQDSSGGPPSPAVLRKWVREYQLKYVLADPGGIVTKQYPVRGFPTNVIVSPDLKIVHHWAGAYRTAQDFISMLQSRFPEMFEQAR